jgi:hypothetical protein
MLLTYLLSALALLTSTLAQIRLDCGECDHIYITCMNACMAPNPIGLGLWEHCHLSCFCEISKMHNCGTDCGFDEGDPCHHSAVPGSPKDIPDAIVKRWSEDEVMKKEVEVIKSASEDEQMDANTIEKRDCGDCNDFYGACMNACTENAPIGVDMWPYCHVRCFCEISKVKDCGTTCGFDEGDPCKHQVHVVDGSPESVSADAVNHWVADNLSVVKSRPLEARQNILWNQGNSKCKQCGWKITFCQDVSVLVFLLISGWGASIY